MQEHMLGYMYNVGVELHMVVHWHEVYKQVTTILSFKVQWLIVRLGSC